MRTDNKTCERELHPEKGDAEGPLRDTQAAHIPRCYANCDSLVRLNDKVKTLQEKVNDVFFCCKLLVFDSAFMFTSNINIETSAGNPFGF